MKNYLLVNRALAAEKNFLLFNQSFGTVGSPNQTGETLTRENRIGLMSYLRRTLMLLFAVLVMSIGEMWGANIFSAVANSSSDLSVSSKSQVQFTAAQATVSGGKMYYTVTGSSNRNILDDSYGPSGNKKKTFCFSGNDQYYSVKLNNTINEGDTIYVEIFADKSLWFTASSVASRPSSAPATATSTGTSGAWTAVKYVIAKNSDLDGVDTLHIWRNSGNTYFSSIWIAQKAASCDAAPTAPTAFAKSSVTSTTATFSITDAAGAASYDIYCSESSTDPTSGTTPTATGITTKTPTVTGLTAGTTYYAWVRAVCDGSHKSSWVALDPTTFTTLAAPTASFNNSTYAIGGSALDLSTLWSSNSAGSVTYSVEDAAGTGASVSTASFSATRAGKAKVKAVQAANGSYDAITKYAYITVGSNVVGKHTVTYDLEVNVDKSRIPVTDSVRSTSLYLTTAEGDTLKGTGVTYSGGQKSGLTGKISAPASYDGNKYVYVQFSIASGYQLTLDSAWCVVQAVGKGKNQNGKLVISDSNSHSFTGSEISCPGTDAGTQTHVVVKGDGSTAFTGTVTLKIYVYGSDATYRLGEKINIHGSLAAVEETCPDAWSFHSKNSSSEWRDPICMELEGDGDFYISEETAINVGDVSYKVGHEGADEAKTTETDWQWMPMGPARNWTVGAHPTASNAGGALGYFYIHSTYTDNNRYIGFFPSSYMLRQGSGESWSNITFNPASSAYGETVWTTPVQKYTASNAADYMYTALGTGNGGAVGCAMSTAMRPIYLKLHSDWKASSPKFYIYYFKNGTDQKGWSGLMQAVPGTNGDDLVGWIPEGDWDRVNFVRFNPSDAVASWDGNVWNCTYAITIDNEKNYYVLDAQGSGGAMDWYGHWDLYHNGFYRIWVDNASTNFALHYVPQYVLEYDNNGGSGSIDPQSVALDADPNTVTVKAVTGFTAPEGKHFVNWNTAPGGGDTSYAPNDSYSLTANGTLYAQWAWNTYDVSTSFTNVSVKTGTTGTGAATHGTAYTVTLQGATGYNLPTTVTVTIGGSPATLTTDYTWNSLTGVLTVLAAKVTGNISITASGVAQVYDITYKDQDDADFSGSHADGYPTTHTYGSSTTLKTASKAGYTFGGWFGNSECTGDALSSIPGTAYTADFTLYAKWNIKSYTVNFAASPAGYGSVSPTSIASVNHGSTVSIASNVLTLKATNVTATPTDAGSDYTYAFSSWSVSNGASITEAQTITANFTRTAKQYSVTHSLTGVTTSSGATGANAATYGTDYTATFAASSGYALPNSVTVTAGGSDITANCTYTKGTGTVSIPGSYITGNIVITVTGVAAVVCPSSASGETVYKFVTKSSDLGTGNVCAAASTEYPQTTSNSLSTLTGGTLKAYGTGSLGQLTFNEDCYKLTGSDNTWLIVELDCAIATGDVIRYVNYASSGNTVMIETTRGTSTSIVMDGNGTMMEQTIVAPAALNGVKTLYLTRKAGTAFLTSFEILRPYTVTLNASTNGGKVGGNNTATMYFKDSESQALPHAFKSSNYFTGWFEDDDSGDAVDNPYTATGTGTLYAQFDACASHTGSLYKFEVKNTLTAGSPFTTGTDGNASMTVGNYLSSLYGGTLDVHGRKTYLTNTTSAFTLTNNSAYLLVTLDCPLQAGDQIKSIVSSSSVAITTSSTRSTTNTLATGTNTITIPDGFAGKTTLYIWRNSANGDISYLEIIRPSGYNVSAVTSTGTDTYGTVSAGKSKLAEDGTTTITAVPATGYKVTNWAVTGTGASISPSGASNSNTTTLTMGTADATVTVTFGVESYTLAWNTNGGSDLDCEGCTSGSTAYGADITAPNDPTLSNYSFDGWKTNNDGTGTTAGATMPAANTTYYAAWKQTVTLTTGAQGSGDNQTPYVYLNGTGVSSITPHTADGYTLQGYYTAGSGGTKVLNANGTFAGSNVTDYITSGKWSRTGAAPTLYAQWVASEDCSTSDFVIKKGSSKEFEGCMESSSYDGTATSFTAGSPTTVGNAKMTISNYSDGVIKRPGSGNTFSIVIEPLSGYYLKSICWAGKVEDGETVSYYWDNNSGSATTITPQTTTGTGVTYNAPSSTTKFTASYTDDGDGSGGIWWRNVQVEVCAAGGTTYSVTYDDNDATGGTAPTDASSPYAYGATVTVLGNTGSLAKTNYTFAGWATKDDGTGSSYVADNTFSITANTTLYAKWTQSVTLEKNGGSTDGSATAVWNATGLTGITHAKPASGYKLLGYYSASSDGTKVLNSDGSFAATNVTDYITDGKWSRTSATTLYAEYESAGALTWNLIVNSDTTNLSTSTKTSAFTEISTSNMSNATLKNLTYSGDKKSNLTGKISTPSSYTSSDYVYVTFQVASGYKFTPSSISVKVQPVGENEHKAVELSLADATNTLASSSATKCDGTEKGKTTTVTLAGDGTYFTGTVTLKIYVYPHAEASAANYNCYRLGTPITIEGEIEETCATMPSYTSMSYTTTTFAPGADASGSPITIVGGENIDTYQWKYNTTNDRTSGTECGTGTSLTPLTNEGAAIDGTRYYWCEMTNDACGITIKSPAVAITVAAAKSDATVTWDDPASTPNYGGGGYTIKATVDQSAWNGNAADLVITAPAGIRIYNVSSGTDGSSRKYVQADFDVQTSFDRSTYASNIPFTVSAAATASYNAISNDHNVSYSACAGAGEGSSYKIRVRKSYTKVDNKYYWDNTDGWISSPNPSSSIGSSMATTTMAMDFDSVSNTNAEAVYVRTYHDNIKKIRIYADFRANNMTVSNVYKHNDFYTANSKYAVDYSVVYNDDEENSDLGDAAQGYVDITLSDVMMSANDILLVKFNTSRVRPLGAVITESSAGSINTGLTWSSGTADGGSVTGKTQSSANFTITATRDAAATVSLGAVTYSSSNTSCATVNATTGEVTITATGTSDLSTTITATLAASGCYKGKTITYTIDVPGVTCTVETGTLTSDVTSKCSTEYATLTLAGFESGASVQWYKGESTISDDATYDISDDGTTLVTKEAGTYSVMVTNSAGTCSDRSNSITISNIGATASVTKIVDEWYVKNGRLTPDIELWSLSEGATLKSVAWSPDNETGLSCVARGGVIYLEGKSPSSNESGNDIEYTLTATITDECNADHEETTKTIKITHQKNTDKHVLAFVVNGTAKGGFTDGITAAQTTSVGLYNAIAAQFDVLATNIYATDDEKKLKEYYSQFDILCITDYPNTQTKGANSKSYVDAIGSLIDIRPILTMEAFVSKLENWKVKGISGNPKSPTTRQYTMDLQCKDHEIFAGTKLTKVGEGDDAMYRVSMVCDTLEDYKTLDATYGGGAHAEKTDYNYGGKPALQGFTFTQEMIDNDLLPIGLIDDGAGNPLQVGIERQHNMEARLMVLGINSYAMERLADDGERIVINALKYLMKKSYEDIADCSTAFVGGAEGHEKNWDYADNWTGNTVPLPSQKVRILAECEVSSTVHALDVLIVTDGKYNHGSDNAAGKLTIKENGALIVGGKIQAASAPAYNRPRATTPDKLLIETSSTNQAALIFDNDEGETQATVNYHSKGYNDGDFYQFQYFAIPMDYVAINPVFADEANGVQIYTYAWDEPSNDWERRGYYSGFSAFEGLAITTTSDSQMDYTLTGNLASTAEREITLTHGGGGDNMIGNSWMAPINIASLVDAFAEDENVEKTVYIYCAGNDSVNGDDGVDLNETDEEIAGQWLSIPMGLTTFPDWDGLKVIPAMQAYLIKATGETTLTLNYDEMVRSTAETALNEKLRAPKRRTVHNEDKTLTRLRVADSRTHTDLYFVEGGIFSDAFDNGWEATYMPNEGASPQFYAMGVKGKMAVLATDDFEGTVVGFEPGKETAYTISFSGAGNGYYLNDVKTQASTLIIDGEAYSFEYEAGDDANRFYISRTPLGAPAITTGINNPDAAAPKVLKVIYNDKLYIIRGGKVYSADGQVVK